MIVQGRGTTGELLDKDSGGSLFYMYLFIFWFGGGNIQRSRVDGGSITSLNDYLIMFGGTGNGKGRGGATKYPRQGVRLAI